MSRIMVTGANGHVGVNVVRALLDRGHEVVPFVRSTSNVKGLEGLGLTYRYGDILDVESLRAAAAGCAVIIHTAAVYRFWTRNPAEIIEPAVAGTRNLFAAARTAGVRRIVYTSTTFAIGASRDPQTWRTPDDWNDEQFMPYTVAKVASEKLAWQLAGESGMELITLCPDGILGPDDYGLSQSTEMLRDLANGQGVTSNAGLSFIDVRDVADIHAQAVTAGRPGQRYILAGEKMTMKAFGELIAALTGVKPRHIGAGRQAAWLVGGLMEWGARLTGSPPALTRAMALELVDRYHYYDTSLTTRDFDFEPRPAEEMVTDALAWLVHLGQINPEIAGRLRKHQLTPKCS